MGRGVRVSRNTILLHSNYSINPFGRTWSTRAGVEIQPVDYINDNLRARRSCGTVTR